MQRHSKITFPSHPSISKKLNGENISKSECLSGNHVETFACTYVFRSVINEFRVGGKTRRVKTEQKVYTSQVFEHPVARWSRIWKQFRAKFRAHSECFFEVTTTSIIGKNFTPLWLICSLHRSPLLFGGESVKTTGKYTTGSILLAFGCFHDDNFACTIGQGAICGTVGIFYSNTRDH